MAKEVTCPSHCEECGAPLMGGATIHAETCWWYPISYYAIMKAKEEKDADPS